MKSLPTTWIIFVPIWMPAALTSSNSSKLNGSMASIINKRRKERRKERERKEREKRCFLKVEKIQKMRERGTGNYNRETLRSTSPTALGKPIYTRVCHSTKPNREGRPDLGCRLGRTSRKFLEDLLGWLQVRGFREDS